MKFKKWRVSSSTVHRINAAVNQLTLIGAMTSLSALTLKAIRTRPGVFRQVSFIWKPLMRATVFPRPQSLQEPIGTYGRDKCRRYKNITRDMIELGQLKSVAYPGLRNRAKGIESQETKPPSPVRPGPLRGYADDLHKATDWFYGQ